MTTTGDFSDEALTSDSNQVARERQHEIVVEDAFKTAGFISMCRQLLSSISEGFRSQGHSDVLPTNVSMFVCSRLQISYSEVVHMWERLGSQILGGSFEKYDHLLGNVSATVLSVSKLRELGLRKCFFFLLIEPSLRHQQ